MKNRLNDTLFGIIVLILTLILWKFEIDFLYLYCKEWSSWIKIIIMFISPFLILAGIWNLTESIELIIYNVRNKSKDNI